LPVTLEQLARDNGVLWSDKTTPCSAKTAVKVASAVNATVAGLLTRADGRDDDQCVVYPFGSEMTTASFAMYTFSLAVLIQALSLVSFSSVADHGQFAKSLQKHLGFF
jgi:UMF1 family MFS transporter